MTDIDTINGLNDLSPEEIEVLCAQAIAERDAARRRYNDHIIRMRDPKMRVDKRWLANAYELRPRLSADWDEKKAHVIRLEQARQAAYRRRKEEARAAHEALGIPTNPKHTKFSAEEADLIIRLIDGDDFTDSEEAHLADLRIKMVRHKERLIKS